MNVPRYLAGLLAKAIGSIIAIGAIIVAVVWLADVFRGDSATASSPGTTSSGAAANRNDDVTVGGLSYHVDAVRTLSTIGQEGFSTKANGEFIIVRLSIRNDSSSGATVNNSDFHLESDGRTFDASVEAMVSGKESFEFSQINPGLRRVGNVAFDVPANTSPREYVLLAYGNGGRDQVRIPLSP